MITITVQNSAQAQALLQGMYAAATGLALKKAVGRRAANLTRKHYNALDASHPNKLGGPRSHFWAAVADSVHDPSFEGNKIKVTISHPIIAHKAGQGPAGGVIVPKEHTWLAIPVTAESYGQRPLSFAKGTGKNRTLTFVKKNEETAYLFERLEGKGPKGGAVFVLQYVLKKKVFQKAFSKALPDWVEFGGDLTKEASGFLKAEAARLTSQLGGKASAV